MPVPPSAPPTRRAAIRLSAEDLAGSHLAPLVSQGAVPSLAWAVVQGQDVVLGGAGGAGPRTIFQIGSVTKVFTALLLADMAERGEVHLADLAARYLRDGVGPVTLADLATHTSGLPRLPRGLFWFALLSPRDPYARYPERRFVRAARRALWTGRGGSPYRYSNFGYGLLGYLLGQARKSTYQALTAARICGPLGLPDTTFEVPEPSRDRKAQGLQRGHAVPDWHLGPLAGAGALYSTAADLGTLLQVCLGCVISDPHTTSAVRLAPAIRATIIPRQPIPGGEVGLAWHHTRRGDHTIIWHNGRTGGFSAMVAFDPARSLGIAALANTASRPPSPLDEAVLGAFG